MRITVTAPSGATYAVIKAKPLQYGEAGLSPMIKIAASGDAEALMDNPEVADAAFALMRKVLARFMVKPRLFTGHPADLPVLEDGNPDPAHTTFEDMGNDVAFVFEAITTSGEAQKAAAAASDFRSEG